MAWSDERVELLKRMWGEGASASQIAKELGGVTRNAVIGKVHRLGLSNRTSGAAPAAEAPLADEPAPEPAAAPAPEPEPEPEPEAAAPVPAAEPVRPNIPPANQPLPPQPSNDGISPEAIATVRETEKNARKLDLMELTERTCKWPIGDPATEEFWFCGLPVKAGKPYCEAHVGLAFQPMSSRRDRRR